MVAMVKRPDLLLALAILCAGGHMAHVSAAPACDAVYPAVSTVYPCTRQWVGTLCGPGTQCYPGSGLECTTCVKCPGGRFQPQEQPDPNACTYPSNECKAGEYSSEGASECEECEKGT